MVTLDFILNKELAIFSEIPKNNLFILFQGIFLGCQKIRVAFGKKRMFCYVIYCWYQNVITSSQVDMKVTREALSAVCPLWVVKSKIRIMSQQLAQRCIIHSQFDESHTALLTRSLYVTSQFRASTNKMMFWWVVKTHTEFVPDESTMTHHLRRRVQNLENPTFTSGFLSLNATNN